MAQPVGAPGLARWPIGGSRSAPPLMFLPLGCLGAIFLQGGVEYDMYGACRARRARNSGTEKGFYTVLGAEI